MNGLTYLLQVNLYLIIFFGFYWLLLRNETFNNQNRAYLVISAVASFAIPLWNSDWVQSWFITQKTTEALATINIQNLAEYKVNSKNADNNITSYISIFYICISLLFATKLIVNIFNLYRYFYSNESLLKAFSFFNNIFVANDIDPDDVIYNHERVHATQYHSFDVLLFEIVGIFCWFNPIIYAYKIAIKNIHEFIADDIASQKMESKAAYAMLLFSEKFQTHPNVLASNFFSKTSLKIRIEMLTKKKSNRTAILKYGLIAPVFMGMLVFTSVAIAKGKEFSVFFNKKSINGQILNQKNQPIVGARVKVMYTNIGANSDEKGFFTLPVNELNTNLVFSHIGYKSKYLKVNSENPFTVSLKTQNNELNSIVVLDNEKNDYLFNYQPINISKNKVELNNFEQNAEFIGGKVALYSFLKTNLNYPAEARKNKKEGVVFTNFTIEKDGSISNIKLVNPLGYIGFVGFGIEEEAKRVLRLMPNWQPAIQNGQPQATSYSLPIQFLLNDKQKISQDEPKLYYVNGVLTTEKIAMAIDPDKIHSVSVLKNEEAIKKYGEKGKSGVIEIILKDENINQNTNQEEEIFTVVEKQAEFPGDYLGLAKFLQRNLHYPPRAQNAKVEATVFVTFVVRKSGEITDIKILKGAGFGLDEEAIRVVKAMPKWKPATQSDRAVSSVFNLPISFNLR